MKKVTLLGDSIRLIGYGLKVPEFLGEDYEVFQPDENCRYAKYTLRGLYSWEKEMEGSDIVHWNNGLWDVQNVVGDGVFTPETEYVSNMLRIADILLKRYGKVIFATTTPVVEGSHTYNIVGQAFKNADIDRYNSVLVPLLREKGIIINDLNKLVATDVNKYIREDDHTHLSDEGIIVCARQVADMIRSV